MLTSKLERPPIGVAAGMGVIALALYFWNLGGGSLEFWDEALTAERSREIWVTGDWLTPHSGGQPDFNKPPLYYWLTAALLRVLGENEFAVRFWSVAFGLGCIVVAGLLAARAAKTPWAGVLAAFFLATNPHWINYTRQGMTDSGLMLSMLSGIYFLQSGRSILGGVCLALGCLAKNPLTLLALGFPLLERRPAREIRTAALVAIPLGLAWYVVQYLRWGSWFVRQFVSHNILQRATTAIEGHVSRWYFPLETWWGGSTVSLLLLVIGALWAAARHRKALKDFVPHALMLLLFLALITASTSKRGTYLLLVYPFAAILSGGLWFAILAGLKRGRIVGAVIVVLSLAYLGARYKPEIVGQPGMKEAALKVKEHTREGDSAICVNVPPDAFMFYSGVLSDVLWSDSPGDELVRRAVRDRPGALYVVARQDQRVKALPFTRPPFFTNAEYVVLCLPPPGEPVRDPRFSNEWKASGPDFQ